MCALKDNKRYLNLLTIITSDYVEICLALTLSLKKQCKSPFYLWVCCMDEESHKLIGELDIDSLRPFRLLDIPDTRIASIGEKYEIPESCYVSKAFSMKHLFNNGISELIYIDADMCCLSDPTIIFEKDLKDNSIILTPHLHASKRFIADYGEFNAGFVGLRNDANSNMFLDWWIDRCFMTCKKDFSKGYYDDQRYLNEVPKKFTNVKIVENPGYNAGPWFFEKKETYTIDFDKDMICNSKLFFYHFSGLQITDDFKVHNKGGYYNHLITSHWPIYRKYLLHILEARKMLGYSAVSESNIKKPQGLKQFYWNIQKINPLCRIDFLKVKDKFGI